MPPKSKRTRSSAKSSGAARFKRYKEEAALGFGGFEPQFPYAGQAPQQDDDQEDARSDVSVQSAVMVRTPKQVQAIKQKMARRKADGASSATDEMYQSLYGPDSQNKFAAATRRKTASRSTGTGNCYCFRCRRKVQAAGASSRVTERGAVLVQGTCPLCSGKVAGFQARA